MIARLADVADVIAGQSPPSSTYNNTGIGLPFFQGKADFGSINPTARVWCTAPERIAEPQDVLVSIRAPVGPTNIASERCGIGRGLAAVRARPHLADPDYLSWALRWSEKTLVALGSGSTFAAITRRDLDGLLIPLPPLDEQRRIAVRLREQLAEAGRVASAAQARIDEMNGLAQRAIDAAIPASDAIALGHALRTSLRTGLSRAASTTANHKVLTLSSVRNGILDVGQNRPMDATDAEALANAVLPSTFYVVRGNGSLHMAGAGALSPESSGGVVLYPDLLIQVDPDPALFSVDYLALAWRSQLVRRQVEARLRTSAGIHKINLANLSTVEVPTPSIGEQRQIAARLREQLAEIGRAKASLEAQCAAVVALPAALLREAFADMAVIGP